MMKIVGLGWGSLVWDPREFRVVGQWHTDGPSLPIEFARASEKGEGRLTLVVTPGAAAVPVLWAEVGYPTAAIAREALRFREECRTCDVGIWPAAATDNWLGADAIGRWAESKGFDYVVWTALPPKFNQLAGEAPSSAQAAVDYLTSRNPSTLAKAEGYVRRAPSQIRTPFRDAFERHFHWVPEPAGRPVEIPPPGEAETTATEATRREECWLADNQDALKSSNAFVEQHGLPLAKYRDV